MYRVNLYDGKNPLVSLYAMDVNDLLELGRMIEASPKWKGYKVDTFGRPVERMFMNFSKWWVEFPDELDN